MPTAQQVELEKAAQALSRCRTCNRDTSKKYPPFCVCGGGVTKQEDPSSGAEASKKEVSSDGKTKPETGTQTLDPVEKDTSAVSANESEDANDINFDPKVILALLARGDLIIENNVKKRMLSIELQVEPHKLSAEERYELRKFMRAVLKALGEFQKEHPHIEHLNLFTMHKEKGEIVSLNISLPTDALYLEFIARLTQKQLLLQTPNNQSSLQEKVENSLDKNRITPNPCATKPIPGAGQKRVNADEEEKNQAANTTRKTWLPRLTPKNYK